MKEGNVGILLIALALVGGLVYVETPPRSSAPARAASTVAATSPAVPPVRCETDARCVSAASASADAATQVDALHADWLERCRHALFVVMTVPDPVDAHTGWQFDPLVEAVQRAAEAAHYALDRFALPWATEGDRDTACSEAIDGDACGKLHTYEQEPGVMVYRRRQMVDAAARRFDGAEWLIVLLVGETPTGGIHKRALVRALDRVAECSGDSIRILGPTYSGTARSLGLTLRTWWERWAAAQRGGDGSAGIRHCALVDPDDEGRDQCRLADAWEGLDPRNTAPAFTIRSGTATSLDRLELDAVGRKRLGTPVVDFGATVLPDALVSRLFVDGYLREALGVCPEDVALLVEADTGYGQANVGAATPRQVAADTGAPSSPPHGDRCVGEALTLPFPMHIAGARSALSKVKEESATLVPGSARPRLALGLEEQRQPPDLLAPMYPRIAGPATETVLASILSTISRRDVKYVGILASDSRDKLFLARQIRTYCPDVRIFTFESDLFYAHPEARAAMLGTLVASTYPLFNRTQSWTRPWSGRRVQFPNSAAQGVYNALLALLGDGTAYLMVDYGDAFASVRGVRTPPLWISAVGVGGLWPLAQVRGEDGAYVYRQTLDWGAEPSPNNTPEPDAGSARSAALLWLALTVFCWTQAIGYAGAVVTGRPATGGMRAWLGRRAVVAFGWSAGREVERAAYLVVAFGTLTATYAFGGLLFAVQPEGVSAPAWMVRTGVAATLVVLGAVVLHAGGRLVAALRQPRAADLQTPPGAASPRALVAAAVLAGGGVGLACAGWLGRAAAWAGAAGAGRGGRLLWPEELRITYERVTNLESGLSPLLPVVLVGAVWFVWARCQLHRIWLVDKNRAANPLSGAPGLSGAGIPEADARIARQLARPFRTPPVWQAVTFWTLPAVLLWWSFLPTFEGAVFDVVFKTAFLLGSLALVAAFATAAGLWWRLRWLLGRLEAHPIAAAFGAVPEAMRQRVRDSFYAYVPSVFDEEARVDSWRCLERGRTGVAAEARTACGAAVTDEPPDARLARAESALAAALATGSEGPSASHTVLHATLAGATSALVSALAPVWERGALGRPAEKEPSPSAAQTWLRRAEDLVATQVVVYIGSLFRHLRALLGFVTIGVLLLVLAVPSYPFQPSRLLNLFVWALVVALALGAIVLSVQINRCAVLSRITGTTPNRLDLDRPFVRSLVVYAGLPLLSLIATQIPVIGETLFAWVEPALRALR